MPNNSQTGGALQVASESFNIYHVIHDFIAGVTGIDNTLIRPMYQPNPPTIPPLGTDWIAYNITSRDEIGHSYQSVSTLDVFKMQQQKELELTISIYGSNALQNITNFRAAIELSQNWDSLRPYNISFQQCGKAIRSPELYNMRWLDKYTIIISLNQLAITNAPIISLINATPTILK